MKPLLPALLLLASLSAGGLALRGPSARVEQPIAFDHARHAEEGLACLDCHARAAEGPYATLPLVKACLLCHAEPQGESPDEPKVRAFAESQGEIPWVQVNRVPGHVYFSHEAHVRWGRMTCAECHGDMEQRTEPVTESQIDDLTMRACMACHFERRVTNDCLACHK